MPPDQITSLERMIDQGRDSAMLRLTLGNAYAKQGDRPQALTHLAQAVVLDPAYSAAWKTLGLMHLDNDDPEAARNAWQRGLSAAREKGDMQVVRELEVRLRKLQKD